MKKILMLIFIISLVAGCIGGKSESPKEIVTGIDKVSSQVENVKIDSIIFTRTGTQVNLKEEAQVTFANVYNNDTKMASQNVNSRAKDVFMDFKWEPKKQYKIEVQTANGIASSTVYAPGKPTALKLGEIKLKGNIEPQPINTTYGITGWGIPKYSPDGRYLVVGTGTGYIEAFEATTNNIVWEKKLSEGIIQPYDFSQDSKYLILGEKSVDGFIYAFELSSGKEIWRFKTGDEIGSDIKNQPAVGRVQIRGNVAYAVASRMASGADLNYYWTRIYAFDVESGRVLWRYPENEVMDSNSAWVGVSSDGKYIAFVTGAAAKNGKIGNLKYKGGELVVLNSEGKKLWGYDMPPVPYQDSSGGSKATSFSKDGKYLITTNVLGAGYFFDMEETMKTGKFSPIWNKDLCTAIEISGIPVASSSYYGNIIGNNVLFSTGSSNIPSKAKSAKYSSVPAEHPNGNTLLVYDLKGGLLWKWKIEGYTTIMDVSKDDRFFVLPIAMNKVTFDINVHGVYVFDNAARGGATSKISYIYKTQGVVPAVAISPDGKYIAAIEAPTRLEDGTVIGEYKLHILI